MHSNYHAPVKSTSHDGILCAQQINEAVVNTTISQLKAKMEESKDGSLLPIIDALKDCWLLELAKQDRVSISQGILKERIARHAQVLRKEAGTRSTEMLVPNEPDRDQDCPLADTKQTRKRGRFRSLDGGAPKTYKLEHESDSSALQQFKSQLLLKDQCLPGDCPRNVICGQLQIKEFKELNSMLSLPPGRNGPYFLKNGFATLNGKTVYFHKCILTRAGRSFSHDAAEEPELKRE
ncbi:hypothetical protein GL50803_002267 [Giardia duodenalis]|uniref:Uncharacterized protein n=1 Tax=Giardia intestinalis (strain ATCC 50803 / WB clone C6) TaxID=184922 RepID=A8BLI0_GIAIC|nr:hypothetical protein GL50803_002267 [Giardia intestinalis]KAE8302763.1 hypothetical protein GL50803_002267 [Giardia intestinalis]|eukprot:XP_001706298.1 Hypothetical protein GL50803_2267 [Giardia lamblia ATCC 50803]